MGAMIRGLVRVNETDALDPNDVFHTDANLCMSDSSISCRLECLGASSPMHASSFSATPIADSYADPASDSSVEGLENAELPCIASVEHRLCT